MKAKACVVVVSCCADVCMPQKSTMLLCPTGKMEERLSRWGSDGGFRGAQGAEGAGAVRGDFKSV